MNAQTARAALAVLLLVGVGCGSSSAKTDAAASTDAALDSNADALDSGADALDGGACNGIDQLGDPVTTSCDPGTPPATTGGTIADGAYVLTESHFFGACESSVLSETLVVAQGTVQSITTDATTGIALRRTLTIAATSGSATLTETETCPASIIANVAFTATLNQLTIRIANVLGTRVSTFTLQ